MRTKPTKNGAFTLVELLVVMGIIALLAAMLMPVIQNAITQANKGATRAEIQNLETAMQEFQMDFGFYPPHTAAAVEVRDSAGNVHSVEHLFQTYFPDTLNLPAVPYNGGSGQMLVFLLSTKWRANPTAPDEFRLVLNGQDQRTNGGPYYDFPDAPADKEGRVRDFYFVDKFGVQGRCEDQSNLTAGDPMAGDSICYYQFNNNADFQMNDPLNVKAQGVDIWSPGADGVDLISMFMNGSVSGGDFADFDPLVAALNTDGDPDELLTKGDLPYGGGEDYIVLQQESLPIDEITNW